MTEVFENLGKLEWWVNTIVIALIVSVAAGFIRDLIPKWFSGISGFFRRRSLRNAKIIVKRSRLIASNNNLFSEYLFRIYMGILFSILLAAFAIAFPPLHYFYELNPQYDPLRSAFKIPTLSGTAVGVVAITYLIFSLNFLFGLSRRMKIVRRAKYISVRNTVYLLNKK